MQVALAQAQGRRACTSSARCRKRMAARARPSCRDFAPRMITMKINPEKIRDVIGKGGAVIRALTEETGTHDRHRATTARSPSPRSIAEGGEAAQEAHRGDHRRSRSRQDLRRHRCCKLLDFGAIVQLLPGKDGLLHISQIANERVNAGRRLPEGRPGRARQGARGRRQGPRAAVDEGGGRRRREAEPAGGVDARGVSVCRASMKGRLAGRPFFCR